MKRFSLLALSLAATLSVACSKDAQEDAPAPSTGMKKALQALGQATLVEVPVSAEVLAASGEATVRAFRIEQAEGELSIEEVVSQAFQAGVSDSARPWQRDIEHPERNAEETRVALRYLDQLLPTIELEIGTQEEFRSAYYHWWVMTTQDSCRHADLHIVVFSQARQAFTIETPGETEC